MTGWILYEKRDADKNKEYIEMFMTQAANYKVPLSLVLIEDLVHGTMANDTDIPKAIPDFIINRSRNASVAAHFEQMNCRVFNPSIVTEICNHKRLTYDFVQKHGIPIMDTVYTYEDAASMSFPFVVKPACGHGGDCVTLVHNRDELQLAVNAIKKNYPNNPDEVFQRCASDIGKDLRVYVLNGTVIAAVMRQAYDCNHIPNLSDPNVDIRSNYSLGHTATLHALTEEEAAHVNQIIPLLPFDCIGIDFVYEKGHPSFNEIEDAVGARMLYANSEIDIVSEYFRYIINTVHKP